MYVQHSKRQERLKFSWVEIIPKKQTNEKPEKKERKY